MAGVLHPAFAAGAKELSIECHLNQGAGEEDCSESWKQSMGTLKGERLGLGRWLNGKVTAVQTSKLWSKLQHPHKRWT